MVLALNKLGIVVSFGMLHGRNQEADTLVNAAFNTA